MGQDIDDDASGNQRQVLEQARQLYSEIVVDHLQRPRNLRSMDNPNGYASVIGPCGDTIQIFLRTADDKITETSFLFKGCATTMVSASMAVQLAQGKTIRQALGISQAVILDGLGGLPKHNEHCASLAADALRAAIQDCLRHKNQSWKLPYRQF